MHPQRWSVALLAAMLATGCSRSSLPPQLTLATTTSTRDSGLLDMLLPKFTAQTGIDVRVVAVGTGQALEIGRRGDADVLLTHAAAKEKEFVAAGDAEARRVIMYNDFVLVGPAEDPAQVQGLTSIAEALRRIAEHAATFVSRGDESGTHTKEREIWNQAGVTPEGDWYLAAGSGMASTLRLANEKRGYTLTDRGTFLAQRDHLDLRVLAEGDPLLKNVYAVLVVSQARHPHVHEPQARRFADFLAAPETQAAIGQFGVKKYGQPLFFPCAAESDARSRQAE